MWRYWITAARVYALTWWVSDPDATTLSLILDNERGGRFVFVVSMTPGVRDSQQAREGGPKWGFERYQWLKLTNGRAGSWVMYAPLDLAVLARPAGRPDELYPLVEWTRLLRPETDPAVDLRGSRLWPSVETALRHFHLRATPSMK